MVQDPVCGMQVDARKASLKSIHEGWTLYFCSSDCKQRFDSEPERYLTQGGRPAVEEQHAPRN